MGLSSSQSLAPAPQEAVIIQERSGDGGQDAPPAASADRDSRSPAPAVMVVFVLAALADVLSGDQLVHAAALLAVGGALGWDALRNGGRQRRVPANPEPSAARILRSRWIAPAGLVYAVVAGTFVRYSWPATIAILAPAAIAVVIAWRGPIRDRPDPGPVGRTGVLIWLGLFGALALWEFGALLLQPSLTVASQAHPTLSTLMDTVLVSYGGRCGFLGVWLAVLWLLVER